MQSNVHVSNQRINVHVQHVLKEKIPLKERFFQPIKNFIYLKDLLHLILKMELL